MTRAVCALAILLVASACAGSNPATETPTANCATCPSLRGFVAADGALLKMQVAGDLASARPVVVFVHDWAHDSGFFYQQAAGLRSRFAVVTYDLRGHGASTDDAGDGADVASHAADLDAVLETVAQRTGGRPVHLVGHGVGAWIALALAADKPDRIRSLALVSPSRAWPDDVRAAYRSLVDSQRAEPTSYRGWTNKLLPVWVAEPTLESRPDVLAFYDSTIDRLAPDSAAGTLAAVVDHEVTPGALASLEMPVLILFGELDAFPGRVADEQFFADASDVTQLRIPGAARDAPYEAPNAVNMALARFFAAAR